jgi:poly(A) polymerase
MRLADAPNMRKSKLRQLIGSSTFAEELELHRLDCISSHSVLTTYHFLRECQKAFLNEPALPPPIITGKILISCGYTPSPHFKNWLQMAYEHQLEGETNINALLSLLPPPP